MLGFIATVLANFEIESKICTETTRCLVQAYDIRDDKVVEIVQLTKRLK